MAKKQFPLRIDADLWAEIARWAADEMRSINGQIEYLLRQAADERRRRSRRPPPPGRDDRG